MFILVYSVNTAVLVAAGAFDNLQQRVNLMPPVTNLPLGAQQTDGVPSIAISNAVNNVPYVWVEIHRHQGNYYWNAGMLLITQNQQSINSWTTTGTHFDGGDSNPSVAINDSGIVVSVHSTGNKLYSNIGTVDTLNMKVNIGGGTYYGSGTLPQVALSNTGQVIEIHIGANGVCSMVGTVQADSHGKLSISWDPSGAVLAQLEPWTDQMPACVSLLDDNTVYVTSGQSNGYRQGIIVDNFANWAPPYPWLKYSGAWGKPGSVTIAKLAGQTFARYTSGPPGPAFRASYVNGPPA